VKQELWRVTAGIPVLQGGGGAAARDVAGAVTPGAVNDTMAVTTTYRTTRWLSNDMFAVTGQTPISDHCRAHFNADNVHYVK